METTAPSQVPESSVFGRMFNILAAPGEVFAEIKERPVNHANWLVPAVVTMVVGIASILILFSQDWAMNDIHKTQEKAMAQAVKDGKMSQAQADQTVEMMRKMMPLFVKIAGGVAVTIYAFALPFFWAFLIWLTGVKILKGDFDYWKGVEAAGLGGIIYNLAAIIGLLYCFVMGKLGYVSAAIFVKDFDVTNKIHIAIGTLNPFYLWFAGVMALAAAVLAGKPWARAAGWIFLFWILTRALLIPLNLGSFVL